VPVKVKVKVPKVKIIKPAVKPVIKILH
jgi:hypothetical protein